MKICAVQLQPQRGALRANLQDHLHILRRTSNLHTNLIIFPELSLSSYEPTLASTLARPLSTPLLNALQTHADAHNVTICAGLPTHSPDRQKPHISMLIFQAHTPRSIHSKTLLHSDEVAYFLPGDTPPLIDLNGHRVGLGICYESLQAEHITKVLQHNADLYLASVAKSQRGIESAHAYFADVARTHRLPIVLSNSFGPCDNFTAAGQSAAWNPEGTRVACLPAEGRGFVVYDTETHTATTHPHSVQRVQIHERDDIIALYQRAARALQDQGSDQWSDTYPSEALLERDIRRGVLYSLTVGARIVGAVHVSRESEEEYNEVAWMCADDTALIMHRLVVDPEQQGRGYAKDLMDFVEGFAREWGYASVRLDVYSRNTRAVELYVRRGFVVRGDVRFSGRVSVFHCMEKDLNAE